ncbi:MAG: serine/threonine protein phosphatase [Clostridia bacterium]|nr:serine/threonine protein phosphatase [Clostridia bacterium]
MKTIVIGDVHGCSTALNTMLTKVKPENEDTLVMLGDLFDRGPDSFGVFKIVQHLARKMGERFILLRGNHEDYLLQPKLSLMQRIMWERVGRSATVQSFKAHGEKMEAAIPWIKDHCRLYWRGGAGIQCVHAGLRTDPPEVNDTQTLVHDHQVVMRNEYDGPLTIVGHIALDMPVWFAGDGETEVNLPYSEWKPLPDRGIICIDTGCGKGGCLTAMIVEDGQFKLEGAAP